MNLAKLRKFLIDANKMGYATGDAVKIIKEKDRSKTITYKDGDWMFHDNYFGGEPYGGREVIFYKDKPLWMMVYYGWVGKDVKDIDKVYKFLQKALMRMPKEHPYRGPSKYKSMNYVYKNDWNGSLTSFSGEETIAQKGKIIYKANYTGGLINQRD